MSQIQKVYVITWVDGNNAQVGYHVVRFQDMEGNELVACVFDRPGYVSVVQRRGAATVAAYPVHDGGDRFELDLREEIRAGEVETSKVARFRAAAKGTAVDPGWYGRKFEVPVTLKGKTFNARYTVVGIRLKSNGQPVVRLRTSRGRTCDMSVSIVARHMGDPPRPRGRAIDLGV